MGAANFMEALFFMKTNFGGSKFVESVHASAKLNLVLHTCSMGLNFVVDLIFNIARFCGGIEFS